MDSGYSKTAHIYDKLYDGKDYAGEVWRLMERLDLEPVARRRTLLDVACGTGRHLEFLSDTFDVEGLDLCEGLLAHARRRLPGVRFHQGDIVVFDLGKRFDVVTCLFSAIGYTKTVENLRAAVACMARHLEPDGVLAIEPWILPENWQAGKVHAQLYEEPDLKIARVNTSCRKGNVSVFDLHHLVATPEGTEHIVEHHEMGLFSVTEMTEAIEACGLCVQHDEHGLTGRGLFIGRRA
jgi:SAM-dependent methyltransferase